MTAPAIQPASMTIVSTPPGRGMIPCACGCPEWITDPRGNRKYFSERCRQRAYRRRLREELREHGLPERLNLQTARGTRRRSGDAPKRRSVDLRISYRKAVDAVAAELERRSSGTVSQRARAERALAPLLTDRQRKALEAQS